MAETFGDVVIRIFYTIISGIVNTTVSILRDVALLFRTLSDNLGNLSILAIAIGIIILGLLIFGLFRLFKGQIKPLIIAVGILAFILFILMLL